MPNSPYGCGTNQVAMQTAGCLIMLVLRNPFGRYGVLVERWILYGRVCAYQGGMGDWIQDWTVRSMMNGREARCTWGRERGGWRKRWWTSSGLRLERDDALLTLSRRMHC